MIAVALGLAACAGGTGDTGAIAPTFSDAVLPVYLRSCDDCHAEWGGYDADAVYSAVLERVVPGDAGASLLYRKIAGSDGEPMPLAVTALSPDEVGTVGEWIEAGAPDGAAFEPVAALLEAHACAECHGEWWTPSLYAALAEGEVDGWRLVVPGSPDESLLYRKIDGGTPPVGVTMPLQEPALDDAQIAAVAAWIEAGAPNDAR